MINHSINRICIHPIENATFARTLVPINLDSFWFNDWLFWCVLFYSDGCFSEWKKPPNQRGMRISSAYCAHMMLLACRFYWCRHHQHLVYLLLVSPPPPPPQRLEFTSFFFLVWIAKQLVGVAFFVLTLIIASYSWIIFFFLSRLLFTRFLANHREILSLWVKQKVSRFFCDAFFRHIPRSACSALVLCRQCIWFAPFRSASFIYVYVAVFRLLFHFYFVPIPKMLGACFSLMRTAFFPNRFCLLNNNVDVVPQFSVDHCIAKGKHSRLPTVKRIINVFGVGFLFRNIQTQWKLQTTIKKNWFFLLFLLPHCSTIRLSIFQHTLWRRKGTFHIGLLRKQF